MLRLAKLLYLLKIFSVATDGAPAMRGAKQGLMGLLTADTLYSDFIPLHCIGNT
jgi:hypothetical protein